jgi:4-amino-4-deoxy-L-arabinose transferase-like glycosyltransferase
MIKARIAQLLWNRLALAGAGLLGVAVLLAWVSSGFESVAEWFSFLVILLLAGGLLYGSLRYTSSASPPSWLTGLVVGAALLRLAAGVFWFLALPAWGYETPVEQAGYVMEDAYQRDRAAWELAQSGEPLWAAFTTNQSSDQYGGILFISALIYRYLGGSEHMPLLMVVVTATFSALAVLFTWSVAARLWDGRVAALASWGLALYPEAVLLGSSQMREAFTISLLPIAIYSLLRYRQEHRLTHLALLVGGLLFCLALSPAMTGFILMALISLLIFSGERRFLQRKRVWILFGFLGVCVLIGVWMAWNQVTPQGISNPLDVLSWWFKRAAEYQAYLMRQSSGWIQRIFRETPEFLHMPLLVTYGVVQPFLPATLVAGGAPIWQGIAIWRALGWTVLLILLLYAGWVWLRQKPRARLVGIWYFLVWAIILVAAFRSGGDQWDNPRYRATFASMQIALSALALVQHREAPDPWFKRVLVGAGLTFAWFLPWYLRRYYGFPWEVIDPFKTLGLGLASAVLYWMWDLAHARSGSSEQVQ